MDRPIKTSRAEARMRNLERRYFEGLTTEKEEDELREYLMRYAADDDTLRPAMAVMAYTGVRRTMQHRVPHRRVRRSAVLRGMVAAALILLASALTVQLTMRTGSFVAVNGSRTYSDDLAQQQMCQALELISSDYPSVEDDLSVMFEDL